MKEKYCTILFAVKKALGVDLPEYVVLDTIFHLENHNKKRGCFAEIKFYMEITDMSERSVQRLMKRLVDVGYLEVEKTSTNEASRRTTDKYKKFRLDVETGAKMTPEEEESGRQNGTRRVTKRHPPGAKLAEPPIYNNNYNNNETSNGTSPLQVKKKKKAKKVDEPPKVESEEVGHPCAFIGKESGDLCKNKQMKNSEFCSHHAVQEIIDAFKPVNESYLTFYGKKNQHGACKDLITTYPKHEILAMIKLAASYNKMPYRAAGDKVYTPHDLFKKWSVMKDNLISYKLQVTQRQKEKQGATKEIVR